MHAQTTSTKTNYFCLPETTRVREGSSLQIFSLKKQKTFKSVINISYCSISTEDTVISFPKRPKHNFLLRVLSIFALFCSTLNIHFKKKNEFLTLQFLRCLFLNYLTLIQPVENNIVSSKSFWQWFYQCAIFTINCATVDKAAEGIFNLVVKASD